MATAGTTATGVTPGGEEIGVVAAVAVCDVTVFADTLTIVLGVDSLGGTTPATEGAFVAGGGWDCGLSRFFNVCSKAARAAAWVEVSTARTEMKLALKATHKPKKIVVFITRYIFIHLQEHAQGQSGLYLVANQFCLRANGCWG